jgi:shikimate-5-dehydrogenase
MHRAAVLGKPIAHSLSPVLHNAGYVALGLTGWSYTAIECAEADLPDLLAGLDETWAGLSLTMPLKEVALAVADEVTPGAAAIGAANTLVRTSAGWRADNTDAPGMVDAVRSVGIGAVHSVAVLGAGGTARAALAAAHDLAAESVTVYARRAEAVDAMRSAARGLPVRHRPWDEAVDCGSADLVISTVPKGVTDQLRPDWQPGSVLFDAIYDPWPTPLAATAAAAGVPIVSGLDLLLFQAVRQFRAFTGAEPPVPAMRSALFERRQRTAGIRVCFP